MCMPQSLRSRSLRVREFKRNEQSSEVFTKLCKIQLIEFVCLLTTKNKVVSVFLPYIYSVVTGNAVFLVP